MIASSDLQPRVLVRQRHCSHLVNLARAVGSIAVAANLSLAQSTSGAGKDASVPLHTVPGGLWSQTPDSARKLDMAAAALARGGRYAAALSLWKQAAQLAPDDVAAHFNAGMMYEMTYHAADALREFQIAYHIRPDPVMLYHLGVAFHNVGARDSALKWFRVAVANNPSDASSFGYAALTESEMGRDSDAVADWRRAMQFEPHYFERVEPQLRQLYEHSLQAVATQRDSSVRR